MTPTRTASLTPTRTATRSPSLTPTHTPAPLGARRLSLDPALSTWQVLLRDGTIFGLGGFRGQTNGVGDLDGFLDLQAGVVDPGTGQASVDVVAASDFLYLNPIPGIVFCLKPSVPSSAVAVLDCDGGVDFSKRLRLDHNLGVVSPGGFSSNDCLAANGRVEGDHRLCSAGRVDEDCRDHIDCDSFPDANDGVCGITDAACTAPPTSSGNACRADGDCDSTDTASDGVCSSPGSHARVCNGPLVEDSLGGDSWAGALRFHPPGFPATLAVETSLPCGDEEAGLLTFLPFTTGSTTAVIQNADNVPGAMFSHSAAGTNFSCQAWGDSAGAGCLVMSIPALDQFLGQDTITEIRFCGP